MPDDFSQLLADHPEIAELATTGWASYPDLVEKVMQDPDMGALRDLMVTRYHESRREFIYLDPTIGSPEARANLAKRYANKLGWFGRVPS